MISQTIVFFCILSVALSAPADHPLLGHPGPAPHPLPAAPHHPKPYHAPQKYEEHYEDVVPKYDYHYGVKDEYSQLDYSHQESRDGYTTTGQYRTRLPDCRIQIVTYTAGKEGYVADVKYEGEPCPYEPKPHHGPAPYHPEPHKPAYKPVHHEPAYKPVYHEPAYKPAHPAPYHPAKPATYHPNEVHPVHPVAPVHPIAHPLHPAPVLHPVEHLPKLKPHHVRPVHVAAPHPIVPIHL